MRHQKDMPALPALLLTILLTASAILIPFIQEMNVFFLIFYAVVLILLTKYRKGFPATMITYCRIILGLLFIFSGLSKGVDPLGTTYKIEDYYVAYGMDWAMPLALLQSFGMNAFEFVLGVGLLFKIKPKLITILTTLMMAVFTFTTYMDAMYNIVPDCGCFGEAITISNWQTFYKNLTIMLFLFVLLVSLRKTKSFFFPTVEWRVLLIAVVLFGGFEYYNYSHLPMVDFRDWKVGNKMVPDQQKPIDYYVTYKNLTTLEEKEFLTENLPWNDSIWMSEWTFVSQRIYDPNAGLSHDLSFEDEAGNNVTSAYIENPDPQFILVSWTLEKFNKKKLQEIKQFYAQCEELNISFIILTSSDIDEIAEFVKETGLESEIFRADDIALKTMVRANPGLLLLKNSVVLDKWHYRDIPKFERVKMKYFPEM